MMPRPFVPITLKVSHVTRLCVCVCAFRVPARPRQNTVESDAIGYSDAVVYVCAMLAEDLLETHPCILQAVSSWGSWFDRI